MLILIEWEKGTAKSEIKDEAEIEVYKPNKCVSSPHVSHTCSPDSPSSHCKEGSKISYVICNAHQIKTGEAHLFLKYPN